jgi:hypothetical protein
VIGKDASSFISTIVVVDRRVLVGMAIAARGAATRSTAADDTHCRRQASGSRRCCNTDASIGDASDLQESLDG